MGRLRSSAHAPKPISKTGALGSARRVFPGVGRVWL
jgi:hypothetical protein